MFRPIDALTEQMDRIEVSEKEQVGEKVITDEQARRALDFYRQFKP